MNGPITVDSALAEMEAAGAPAYTPENSIPKAVEQVADPKPQAEDKEPEIDENGDPVDPADKEEVIFPKKAVNALNRKTKTINHLKAQNTALEQRLAALEARSNTAPQAEQPKVKAAAPVYDNDPDDPMPTEADHDTLADYLDARARWMGRQGAKEASKKFDEQRQAEVQRIEDEKRDQQIYADTKKFIEEVPDAMGILAANADLINAMPPQLENLFLQCGDMQTAVYHLAKQDKLAGLFNAPLATAAFEIGKALAMGRPTKAAASAPQISSAPPPPSRAANGTGSSQKTVDNLEGDDLRNWYKSA